ncbi:seminal plasma protein HSP-1-like [Diceros bicornis minor]|uniref:seminal plasma protein HSP-1-like n=1 Tax=Diceros bicornis minor TaxID=77932 RepID=UPI0026EACB67|nr:seminal plasma protein HSP-1-like [Diceros bicornis minor]
MAPRLGIFLIWAGACVFLQLDHVDGDYVQCVFPFIYCGQTYDNCTTTGSVFGMPWCSVTPNYDEDGSWKYC